MNQLVIASVRPNYHVVCLKAPALAAVLIAKPHRNTTDGTNIYIEIMLLSI